MVGADVNARSQLWWEEEVDDRRTEVEELIQDTN